ncbi:3-hydroxybutyrate dehydrogenase [Paenibacillus sp. 598K]|uniref:3-hydroxybutyrate dehydrogenase n=1 Tax=Paenibacillus sp. 598K TaxID=1117987 RepID=UPI000FF9C49A|nr:3-hydroxybutyrate dehydrogenase [Paenibacillus sp. 598K]GBF71819.1 3-hydroxybutyrate dehydrogenase [Paenibacillus sp. 598K]
MSKLLLGKTALITGASSGIGLQLAQRFAQEGAAIVAADITAAKAQTAAASIQAAGGEAIGVACDVTDEEQVRIAVERAVEAFGTVHILVNNAGLQHVSLIENFPVERFDYMLRVMLIGAFIGIKHVMPLMKSQGYGRIINMASINGVVGFAGKSAYNSAKHGLIGLTKVAALEGAMDGITVNAICPGYVDTPLVRGQLEELARTRQVSLDRVLEDVIFPFVPQKRLLDVEEIAEFAAFIASDKSRGITGASLLVDGGYTAQ